MLQEVLTLWLQSWDKGDDYLASVPLAALNVSDDKYLGRVFSDGREERRPGTVFIVS